MTLNSDKRKEETKAEEEAAGFLWGQQWVGYFRQDIQGRTLGDVTSEGPG